MTARFVAAAIAAGLVFLVAASAAAAQSAEAEQLFRDGKRLIGEKRNAEACDAFEASQKIEPNISTLLNLADCRERNGQTATAWGLFLEAARATRRQEGQQALASAANQRATQLEPRLSYLIINVPDESRVSGLVISRNGAPVDPLTWNRALPIDGGTYVIEGKAPGHEAWTTQVTVLAERDKQSVDVPRFKALDGETLVVADVDSGADEVSRPRWYEDKIGWAIVAGGVVIEAGALAFWLRASTQQDAAERESNQSERGRLQDSARTSRTLSGVLAAVGAVAVLVGTVRLVLVPESDDRAVRSAVLEVGPAWVGIAGSF